MLEEKKLMYYITGSPWALKNTLVCCNCSSFNLKAQLRATNSVFCLISTPDRIQTRKQIKPAVKAAGRSDKSFCSLPVQLCRHTEARLSLR